MTSSSSSFIPLRSSSTASDVSNDYSSELKPLSSTVEIDQFRNKHGIEVDGNNIPDPIQDFKEIGLPHKFLLYLKEKKNCKKPTPIQMQAISCLIKNRDCICLSSTGTGKTFAYLLPLCYFLWKNKTLESSGVQSSIVAPYCLIITPTRELMNQVLSVTNELINVLKTKRVETQTPYYHPRSHDTDQDRPPNHYSTFNIQNNWNQLYQLHPPYDGGHMVHNSSNYRPYNGHTSLNHQTFYNQFNGNVHNTSVNSAAVHQVVGLCGVHHKVVGLCGVHHKVVGLCGGSINSAAVHHKVVGLCGGVPLKDNLSQLSSLTQIIVATPGRLIDLCERGHISLHSVQYFVIDECDKMLDMGLEDQLRTLVAKVTINKTTIQTSLWSATLPESLERLARSAVTNPVYISTGIKDTVPSNITQKVMFIHTYLKPEALLDVLRLTPYPPVIVFTSSKHKADELVDMLQAEQFYVAAIHSDKTQQYRNDVIESFRSDQLDILVATDLISRGLDLPAVTHVINFDIPDNIQDYIHRCGRTGRFGRSGLATSFLTLHCNIAVDLKEMLVVSGSEIPPELNDTKIFGKKVLSTDMGDRIV